MYLHPTYAVTPDREPLGVIDAWMWAREARDSNGQRGGLKVDGDNQQVRRSDNHLVR
jgi:hypothetical protein